MIKKTLLLCTSLLIFSFAKAQKGNNGIQIGARAAFPTEKLADIVNTGYGATLKGMYGFGADPHQVTLEVGYNRFGLKNLPASVSGYYAALPIYTGYRYTFGHVIIDTQAGVSFNSVKGSGPGGTASGNQTAFGWAIGVGYVYKKVELGVKYQSSDVRDDIYDIKFVAVRLGYNFTL